MLSINLHTPNSILEIISKNFKQRRLSYNLSQEGLASKSGVSLGSIKRFENTGQISLQSLLKIAVILDCLDDFLHLAKEKESIKSIDELLKKENPRKRGRIK